MSVTLVNNINICLKIRQLAADLVNDFLQNNKEFSEEDFANAIHQKFKDLDNLNNEGWYNPPPLGISALFGSEDNSDRLLFDSLRHEKYWPVKNNILKSGVVGLIYVSPTDRQTGIIGDFGLTIYNGQDKEIQNHLKLVLEIIENLAEFTEFGMEFREIYNYSQKLFKQKEVNNDRTKALTSSIINLGHTIPWTYEEPVESELKIIQNGNLKEINNLISHKRIYLNSEEIFKIPKNIAFTMEARLEKNLNQKLPDTLFHIIVSFTEGQKKIVSDFNQIFETMEMDYIRSKY